MEKEKADHIIKLKEGSIKTFIDLGGKARVVINDGTTFKKIAQKIKGQAKDRKDEAEKIDAQIIEEQRIFDEKINKMKKESDENKDLAEKFYRHAEFTESLSVMEEFVTINKERDNKINEGEKVGIDGLFIEGTSSEDPEF
jgi:uncharacterized Zn finger protein (UPF0148 family)